MTPTAIRKAAILISTLESASADVLLEQMEPELAQRVRNAVMELEEIPADEQQRVIAEFMNGAPEGAHHRGGGVEFEPSLAGRLNDELPETSGYSDRQVASWDSLPGEPPFHFLRDAEPSLIAAYLEKEHPQTAAAVIAHLPPEQAAQVLERMPPAISTEALRRMAWLDQLAPEVLLDLERELKAALLPKLRSKETRLAGLASVQAMLSLLQGSRRNELLGRLAEQDQRLVRQLGYSALDHETFPAPRAEVTSFRYRLEPPPLLSAHRERRTAHAQQQEYIQHDEPAIGADFSDLCALDDRDLRRVFAAAEMHVLVLALTGADEDLIRRILRQLPQRQAQVLQQRLNHPGPLRLRDIEQAQAALAAIAARLAGGGEISLPKERGFAAAA